MYNSITNLAKSIRSFGNKAFGQQHLTHPRWVYFMKCLLLTQFAIRSLVCRTGALETPFSITAVCWWVTCVCSLLTLINIWNILTVCCLTKQLKHFRHLAI